MNPYSSIVVQGRHLSGRQDGWPGRGRVSGSPAGESTRWYCWWWSRRQRWDDLFVRGSAEDCAGRDGSDSHEERRLHAVAGVRGLLGVSMPGGLSNRRRCARVV